MFNTLVTYLRVYKKNLHKNNNIHGFTLIELLVVIAIIGLLAAVVFYLINPVELMARARDSGRIGGVTQLSKAIVDYSLNKSAYPAEASWDQDLETINEVSSFPAGIRYVYPTVTACTTNVRPTINPTFCYSLDSLGGNGLLIFSKLESQKNTILCTAPDEAYVVYSESDNIVGFICSNGDPSPWSRGSVTYVN